ncbi:DUF7288 family protein [Haloarcula salinisoli]|uniref:Uncharacterized protein n=1 Tax=Haloarcula salinisoli TaxID=2487746 RepID=A0A8J8CCM2_9EURY|nr:hypothetical protein [Halomicroarcula salinisoli]MBX0284867.1 hypothetical protein [Halomicroarcula salinisoli]MBX0303655.1 hypothetical protein [Halomicroarcula salinisoli]
MRGQAHTLEATVAGLLMLSSLIFALQMTAVTPLSASTSSQHIENQQGETGQGVLASAAEVGALKPAVLYWNNSSSRYHNAGVQRFYTSGPPDNRFGAMLERAFNGNGIAYNVYFRFQNADGRPITRQYVYSGVPTDNAVTATHTVTLWDDDPLYNADGTPSSTRLNTENMTYPMPDTGDNLYNTVRVEVVAWRI